MPRSTSSVLLSLSCVLALGTIVVVTPAYSQEAEPVAPPAPEASDDTESEPATDTAPDATDAQPDAQPGAQPDAQPDDGSAQDGTAPNAVEHFHGEALHAHVDGEMGHHHHGDRLTHDHEAGDVWHHHHGDDVAHDHPGTDRAHHHHGDEAEDPEGHDHAQADVPHDHLAQTFCPKDTPCVTGGDFAIWPKARLVAGYEFVQPDPNVLFIGQNDGFLLDQARVGVAGTWRGRLGFQLTYDAVTFLPSGSVNDTVREIVTGLRDAFLVYQPVAPLKIWLGQFYMPADIEGQTSRADLNFTSRSVMSGGVRAGRGYPVRGLSVVRETGMAIGNDDYVPFSIGKNDIGFDYRVALSNGNGTDLFGNDNKLPAVFARAGARYGDYLKIGFGGQYNPRTRGELPNLFLETESTTFADITFDMFGFRAVASGIYQWTSFDSLLPFNDPNRVTSAYGVAAWLSVENPFGLNTFGLRPAVRVSYYEPDSAIDSDQLFETTFAVRYTPITGLPLALLLDVTLLFEPGPSSQRQLDNHRATALVVFNL